MEAMFARFSNNVNENTNQQFASIKATMDHINTKVGGIEKDLGEVKQDVGELKTWKSEVEKDFKKLKEEVEAGPAPMPVESGEAASSSHLFAPYPPPYLRKTIIIGLFEECTPQDDIISALKTLVGSPTSVKDYIVPGGKCSDKGKVEFNTPKAMWVWVKANAGKKLDYNGRELWFSVDKPFEERLLGKKIGKVMTEMRGFHERRNDIALGDRVALKKFVEADNNRGFIYLFDPVTKKMKKGVTVDEEKNLVYVWHPDYEGLELDVYVGQANSLTR